MLSRWKREEEAKPHAMSTGKGLASEEQQELRQLQNEVKRLRFAARNSKKALGYFANESS